WRRNESGRRIREPLFGGGGDDPLARAAPAFHGLALLVVKHQRPGPRAVVGPLGFPPKEETSENRSAHREGKLRRTVGVALVAAGDGLGEGQPVAGLPRGLWPVAHELDDGLLLHG